MSAVLKKAVKLNHSLTHKCCDISNHRQLNCKLNSLVHLTTKKTKLPYQASANVNMSCHGKAFHSAGPLWGESTSNWWIPFTKGPVMCKSFPCLYTIMITWCRGLHSPGWHFRVYVKDYSAFYQLWLCLAFPLNMLIHCLSPILTFSVFPDGNVLLVESPFADISEFD